MLEFEAFVEQSNAAKTTDDLVRRFLATVSQHGYDRMIFCLQTDHDHLGMKAGVGVIQNYPDDWMRYYREKGFDQIDPVIKLAQHKIDTFSWAEIPQKLQLTQKQHRCLNLGIESGLYNGICTPIWGPNKFAGIGLATSESLDACDDRVDLITAYCHHFYAVFERLNGREPEQLPNIYLTAREREIMNWAAVGKTDDVIGEILSISANTVGAHLANIYEKLDANNRTLAVVKAISLGLIHPNSG